MNALYDAAIEGRVVRPQSGLASQARRRSSVCVSRRPRKIVATLWESASTQAPCCEVPGSVPITDRQMSATPEFPSA